ncbi:MAG: hypothetical protein GY719_25780 [bacterium]|nr:hypothetical protein [bacterium]
MNTAEKSAAIAARVQALYPTARTALFPKASAAARELFGTDWRYSQVQEAVEIIAPLAPLA